MDIMLKAGRILCIVFYSIIRFLPNTTTPVIGHLCRRLRLIICKRIFESCGNTVDIARNAYWGLNKIWIGNNSGIGPNFKMHGSNLVIGDYVMMGPDVLILGSDHCHDKLDIPMGLQGSLPKTKLTIGNDV